MLQGLFPPSPGGKTGVRFQKTIKAMREHGLFRLRGLSRDDRKSFKNLTRIRIDDLSVELPGKAIADFPTPVGPTRQTTRGFVIYQYPCRVTLPVPVSAQVPRVPVRAAAIRVRSLRA